MLADLIQATSWGALLATGLQGPAPIAIIGIGGLGAYAIQFAKALGHRVAAIDNRPEGRELAKEVPLPADAIFDFNDKNTATAVKEWAGRDGAAAVIVCTDNRDAIKWSLEIMRPHGVVVPVGLPVEPIQFDAFTLIFSEMTIKGSLVATRAQVEDMMEIVARFGVAHRITTIALEDAPRLTDLYMAKDLKGRLVLKL
jgi:D-arabinose 1-dehydrogenase-like Zn-dependent alcohol dehydrogenase